MEQSSDTFPCEVVASLFFRIRGLRIHHQMQVTQGLLAPAIVLITRRTHVWSIRLHHVLSWCFATPFMKYASIWIVPKRIATELRVKPSIFARPLRFTMTVSLCEDLIPTILPMVYHWLVSQALICFIHARISHTIRFWSPILPTPVPEVVYEKGQTSPRPSC